MKVRPVPDTRFGMRAPVLAVASLLAACFRPGVQAEPEPVAEAPLTLAGELCAAPIAGPRPVKLFIALDASQSLAVTDPNGSRAVAVTDLLTALPQTGDISVTVMLFAGNTNAFVLPFLPRFEKLSAITAADLAQLRDRILQFRAPGTSDSTDFVRALAAIRAQISNDISDATRLTPEVPPAVYSVLFLSSGSPSPNQDRDLLCGDAVTSIHALGLFTHDVRVNTVHLFFPPIDPTGCGNDAPLPASASCLLPVYAPGTCPSLLVQQNAQRLELMALLGGGRFRDFRAGALNDFRFVGESLRPEFELGTVMVTNLSAGPGSQEADSDADGLADGLEVGLGTDPDARDTDADGFSDAVERWAAARGRDFVATRKDLGCDAIGADVDCDGLTDCDELVLETNRARADTDDDGLPDIAELQHGTRPTFTDDLLDADADSVPNGEEVRRHTDPALRDPAKPPAAYKYSLSPGRVNEAGAQCFDLRVTNLLLPETRDGQSTLYLSAALRLKDEPGGRAVVQHTRLQVAAGAKTATFAPVDMKVGCGP